MISFASNGVECTLDRRKANLAETRPLVGLVFATICLFPYQSMWLRACIREKPGRLTAWFLYKGPLKWPGFGSNQLLRENQAAEGRKPGHLQPCTRHHVQNRSQLTTEKAHTHIAMESQTPNYSSCKNQLQL